MKTVYQRVRWNVVFEVNQDCYGNLFLFRNGSYLKSVTTVDEAQFVIQNLYIKP